MEKVLKYDFYEIIMPEEDQTPFETILQSVNELQGAARTFDNGSYHVQLIALHRRGGYFLGDLARIRMNDIPDKMRLNGERQTIELDDDQGLGELTSFIYNPAIRALVFMRNKFSVSASGFASYFQNLGHIQGVMYLEHILETDAYRKLARMTSSSKFEVGFAAPGNAAIYANLGLRPQTLTGLMDASPKVKIDFTFSVERDRHTSLPVRSIRTIVRNFRGGDYEENITRLQVSGKEDPEQRVEVVDLLEEVMTEKQGVTLRRNQRAITDHQRHNAIEQAYLRKIPELNRVLANA